MKIAVTNWNDSADKAPPKFAQLFKFYKSKSGFKTYSHFAKSLAEKGIVYDLSLFSHWQRGSRVSSNRELLLAMIKIFTEAGSMKYQDQANLLLRSANKKILTYEEKEKLPLLQCKQTPISIESELEKFMILDKTNKQLQPKKSSNHHMNLKFSFVLSLNTFLYFEKASRENHSTKAGFLRRLIENHRNSVNINQN